MQNIDKIRLTDKFDYITHKGKHYLAFLRTKIAPHIPQPLAQQMLDFCLSPIYHHIALNNIKKHFLSNLSPSTAPNIHIILGQTGAGKSTLAQQLLNIFPNTLPLDSDLYKQYNPLSNAILKYSPTYYGHLTGIDSYLHRQALLSTAIDKRYNILIQRAPSQKNLLNGINLKKLHSANYHIHLHILAVSLPNALLSIHERYEYQISQKHAITKLSDLNRALDSYNYLTKYLPELHLLNPQNITFYTRNYSQNNILQPILPEIKENYHNNHTTRVDCLPNFTPHSATTLNQNTTLLSATLLNHLQNLQNYDLIHSAPTYNDRIQSILTQLSNRNAPLSQIEQFHRIVDIIASTPLPLTTDKTN